MKSSSSMDARAPMRVLSFESVPAILSSKVRLSRRRLSTSGKTGKSALSDSAERPIDLPSDLLSVAGRHVMDLREVRLKWGGLE